MNNQPNNRQGVWCWRDAIRQSSMPTLAKTVCWNLSLYMNDVGAGCFPSIAQQMRDTGLSHRVVGRYLHIAVEHRYLEIVKDRAASGKFLRNKYLPRYPDGGELPSVPAQPLIDDPWNSQAEPWNSESKNHGTEGSTNLPIEPSNRTVHKKKEKEGGTLFDENQTDLEEWLALRGYPYGINHQIRHPSPLPPSRNPALRQSSFWEKILGDHAAALAQ